MFVVLQQRLIRLVNERVSNGEFSERRLARMLRISQPHMHNVLKGIRKLTPELADHILICLEISIFDLLNSGEIAAGLALLNSPAIQNSDQRVAYLLSESGSVRKAPQRAVTRRAFTTNKIA